MRGPAFFAYADNYLIDVKLGIIVDVEAGALECLLEDGTDRGPARLATATMTSTRATPRNVPGSVLALAGSHRSCGHLVDPHPGDSSV
jgi:hypothetical protein